MSDTERKILDTLRLVPWMSGVELPHLMHMASRVRLVCLADKEVVFRLNQPIHHLVVV